MNNWSLVALAGVYLLISQQPVLLTEENEQHGAHIQRSMQVYKRMKKDHLFLTSTNDYPLAVLLAGQSENVETLMDRVERLYQKLAKAGLRKGMIFSF